MSDKMNNRKNFKKMTDSIWFTVLVTMIFFFLLGAVSISTGIIFSEDMKQYRLEPYIWTNAAAQLILSAMIIFVSQKTGIFNKQEWAGGLIGKGLFIGLVGVIFALFQFGANFIGNLSYIQVPDFTYFLGGVFIAFTTGLYEEVLVRGFVYNNFKRHFGDSLEDMKKAIIWSSVFFGVIHVVNLKGFDLTSLLTTLAQIIYAAIIGMYLALVYTKSKSMWTVIMIHSMIDGAIFILYSMLSTEAFQQAGGEEAAAGLGEIVLKSFVLPLVFMIPFVIAIVVKWRKLKEE